MTRQRGALLVVGVVLVAVLLCTGWVLLPSTEPEPVAHPPALQREAERVVSRAQQADAPDPDDEVSPVECSLWRSVGDMADLQLQEMHPETLEPLGWLHPERLPSAMRFTPKRAVGLGWLHMTGYEPGVVSWADGACLDFVELEDKPKLTVSGRVTGVVETGAVTVAAHCNDKAFTSLSAPQPPEALFSVQLLADATSCELIVRRVFGGRDLLAHYPVEVREQEGLEIAVAEAPGVGLGLQEVSEGLRVYGVEPGSPAAAAGLEMMDLVVAVDGEPASDLVADELVEEEGPMVLEVVRGEERFEVTVQ